MRFISPKIDYVFKKVFGSRESENILISFLNAIIYDGEKIIKSLTIINPYSAGQVLTLKDTYLDVKAVLVDGEIVVIEMQMSSMTGFSKQVLYNMAKGYTNQLQVADDYIRLKPVIAVTITDFILFEEKPKVINQFVFQEKEEISSAAMQSYCDFFASRLKINNYPEVLEAQATHINNVPNLKFVAYLRSGTGLEL